MSSAKAPAFLPASALGLLAAAADRGTLSAPFSGLQLGRLVAKGDLEQARQLLQGLAGAGLSGPSLAAALRLAEAARKQGDDRPRPTLVWSDLDVGGSRDTSVVCDELFRGARHHVLVSTFNLGHYAKDGEEPGNPVLRPLAKRMVDVPDLSVRLFLNLKRRDNQANATQKEIEAKFSDWFRKYLWPWERVPEVYYDPRSLAAHANDVACLHAKCVVVDDQRAFVTSANLTEAAQDRNIEAGVLLDDPTFATMLRKQFESLIDKKYVRRLEAIK